MVYVYFFVHKFMYTAGAPHRSLTKPGLIRGLYWTFYHARSYTPIQRAVQIGWPRSHVALNSNMKGSDLSCALQGLTLREVLLERHGLNGPSTHRRNSNSSAPIDGIWATPGVTIEAGGYFPYDAVFLGTDHRCLWVDITYKKAFGHNVAPLHKKQARRLHCKDPRLIDNYKSCNRWVM